jgi:hypothetical protein
MTQQNFHVLSCGYTGDKAPQTNCDGCQQRGTCNHADSDEQRLLPLDVNAEIRRNYLEEQNQKSQSSDEALRHREYAEDERLLPITV